MDEMDAQKNDLTFLLLFIVEIGFVARKELFQLQLFQLNARHVKDYLFFKF